MSHRLGNIALLACLVASSHSAKAGQLLYVAAKADKAIFAYEVNQETGELDLKFKSVLTAGPRVMAFSPDEKFIYAGVEGGGENSIATLRRAEDGSLTLRGMARVTGLSAYLRTDNSGHFLLSADYSAGDVSVYRINDSLCTDELVDHQKTERTAHCIELDPSGQFVFVPHTSPNRVYQFRFDTKHGTLAPNNPPFVDGPDRNHRYHEPRHYVHHPKLDVAYTSNEFGGGITAWKFSRQTGTLQRWKTLSTLPPTASGDLFAADIRLTPNGRFAYVSNRDQTKRPADEPKQDTLAGFALDATTGDMTLIGYFPTPNQPRSICIDRSGKFVYSAGTETSTLFAYRIDQETGSIGKFATYETGAVPLWIMCGSVFP